MKTLQSLTAFLEKLKTLNTLSNPTKGQVKQLQQLRDERDKLMFFFDNVLETQSNERRDALNAEYEKQRLALSADYENQKNALKIWAEGRAETLFSEKVKVYEEEVLVLRKALQNYKSRVALFHTESLSSYEVQVLTLKVFDLFTEKYRTKLVPVLNDLSEQIQRTETFYKKDALYLEAEELGLTFNYRTGQVNCPISLKGHEFLEKLMLYDIPVNYVAF